jgi:N utilization substance protein B
MGTRRRAREFALQLLYMHEFQAAIDPFVVKVFWRDRPQEDATTQEFAMALVEGVRAHLAEVDDLIRKSSTNWRIDRMATVDRNILRMATYELLHMTATPLKVVLNEAIELGKRFGSEDSGAFVNGVLDKVGSTLRGLQKAPEEPAGKE